MIMSNLRPLRQCRTQLSGFEYIYLKNLATLSMAPKQQAVIGLKKVSETAIVRSMKELMRDYEIRAEKYESTVANSIRKQFKKALDDDRLVTRFVVDPQDRRVVEYWDDEKLVKALQGDADEGRRRKVKIKHIKEDKPLVKVLPLIDAIRARRYTHIQELLVWDCHVENDDALAVAGLLTRGCYPVSRLELIDCFLDSKSVGNIVAAVAVSKTLKELALDFNELGEKGCRILCTGLSRGKFLTQLSLSYCGLTKQCGLWLGNLICETAIRNLKMYLTDNCREYVLIFIKLVPPSQNNRSVGRLQQLKNLRSLISSLLKAPRPVLDMDMPGLEQNANAGEADKPSSPAPSLGKKRGKRGRKGGKLEPPPAGPQISVLKLADTGINHMGRGGNFAPVRCMQLLK
ncbi:hypothetical protein CRM22_008159, partial [Opisthorchis felineus]